MATNLALQLQVIEPDTDLNSIMKAIPTTMMMCGI